jgi:type III pantothenate kinase
MKETYLIADIGNTTIDLALYDGLGIEKVKITNQNQKQIEEQLTKWKGNNIQSCLISSVNKEGSENLILSLNQQEIPFEIITPKMMDDFANQYGYTITNTSYLGTDLFCDIIAKEEVPQIIIDLGTVGKILYLDRDKIFHGCAIFPDIRRIPQMLEQSTDLLENYGLSKNPPLVSLKTEECISSGAINGVACLVVSMVKQIKKKYDAFDSQIILTGGDSHYVSALLEDFGLEDVIYDPDLSIKGMIRLLNL